MNLEALEKRKYVSAPATNSTKKPKIVTKKLNCVPVESVDIVKIRTISSDIYCTQNLTNHVCQHIDIKNTRIVSPVPESVTKREIVAFPSQNAEVILLDRKNKYHMSKSLCSTLRKGHPTSNERSIYNQNSIKPYSFNNVNNFDHIDTSNNSSFKPFVASNETECADYLKQRPFTDTELTNKLNNSDESKSFEQLIMLSKSSLTTFNNLLDCNTSKSMISGSGKAAKHSTICPKFCPKLAPKYEYNKENRYSNNNDFGLLSKEEHFETSREPFKIQNNQECTIRSPISSLSSCFGSQVSPICNKTEYNIWSTLIANSIVVDEKDYNRRLNEVGSEKWLKTVLTESCDMQLNKNMESIIIRGNSNFDPKPPSRLNIKCYIKGKMKMYKVQSKSTIVQNKNSNANCAELNDSFLQNTLRKENKYNTSTSDLQNFDRTNLSYSVYTNLQVDTGEVSSSDFDRIDLLRIIQNIVVMVSKSFSDSKIPSFVFRAPIYDNCFLSKGRFQHNPSNDTHLRQINFKHTKSRTNFAVMAFLLAKIADLLRTNIKTTKRELYYEMKHLVRNQDVINTAVKNISCLLNVGPWDLNIISQSGLIYGNMKIVFANGEIQDYNHSTIRIPYDVDGIVEIRTEADFILIVEKEGIFQEVIQEDLPNKLSHSFIMITGKGYPDLTTQLFTNKLWRIMKIPVYILVDCDPHGVQIMLTYRFGSVSTSHISHHLSIPDARWLGVLPSEVNKLSLSTTLLVPKEIEMVERLLQHTCVKSFAGIYEELSIMSQNQKKASIETLIKSDTFLSDSYITCKFLNKDYI